MKKSWKILASLALVIAVAALSACGGGGGGSTTTGGSSGGGGSSVTGTFSVTAGTAADGTASASSTISFKIEGSTAPHLLVNGTSVSSLASATVYPSLALGTNAVAITDGTTTIASKVVTIVCGGASSAPVAGICQPTKLVYGDTVYAAAVAAYPVRLSKSGTSTFAVEKVINNTGRNSGLEYPYFNCKMSATPIVSTGVEPVNCQDSVSLATFDLALNPVTNSLTLATAPWPAGTVWVSAAPVPTHAGWSSEAKYGSDWFFTLGASTNVASYYVTSTGATLPVATFGESVRYMISLNNP